MEPHRQEACSTSIRFVESIKGLEIATSGRVARRASCTAVFPGRGALPRRCTRPVVQRSSGIGTRRGGDTDRTIAGWIPPALCRAALPPTWPAVVPGPCQWGHSTCGTGSHVASTGSPRFSRRRTSDRSGRWVCLGGRDPRGRTGSTIPNVERVNGQPEIRYHVGSP
jgi:hypothetical protein